MITDLLEKKLIEKTTFSAVLEPSCYIKSSRKLQSPQEQNIIIFNGCDVWIENSVTRVTVRHQETCRVMPNSYPE